MLKRAAFHVCICACGSLVECVQNQNSKWNAAFVNRPTFLQSEILTYQVSETQTIPSANKQFILATFLFHFSGFLHTLLLCICLFLWDKCKVICSTFIVLKMAMNWIYLTLSCEVMGQSRWNWTELKNWSIKPISDENWKG